MKTVHDYNIKATKGAHLLKLILDKCERDSLNIKTVLAQEFDITGVYFDSLKSGRRRVDRLEDDKLARIADWLGISKGQVYILAGILESQDFYAYDDFESKLDRCFQSLEQDPLWMGITVTYEEWKTAPLNMRLQLIHFYEQLTSKVLLERAKAG